MGHFCKYDIRCTYFKFIWIFFFYLIFCRNAQYVHIQIIYLFVSYSFSEKWNVTKICNYVIFWSKPKIINKQYFGCCSDLDQVITMGSTFTQLPTCSDSTVSCIDYQISWFKATAEQTAILTLETHGLVKEMLAKEGHFLIMYFC